MAKTERVIWVVYAIGASTQTVIMRAYTTHRRAKDAVKRMKVDPQWPDSCRFGVAAIMLYDYRQGKP